MALTVEMIRRRMRESPVEDTDIVADLNQAQMDKQLADARSAKTATERFQKTDEALKKKLGNAPLAAVGQSAMIAAKGKGSKVKGGTVSERGPGLKMVDALKGVFSKKETQPETSDTLF